MHEWKCLARELRPWNYPAMEKEGTTTNRGIAP